MKVEYTIFGILCAFFGIVGVIYGIFTKFHEPVGFTALLLSSGLALMISFFLFWTGRKIDLRPDDNPDALISDIEGDFGFFSPHSWWPLFLAASGAIVFLGLAVGWWMVIIGLPLLALSAIGWVFEYFRGEDAI
ncbi:cytochrome c oxidase subunit 4 [Allobranchiibius sp. GilTou38]|uniref:cytochrome c oxidase subunit 4 n=1 Tax=Allobranchiibius sp. GilTou38 TaxID=2815210 RepID=UPI001AA19EC9|nr:cytochrome c oxidase subunit 4 [Allobranchiibius sp. GilTou38]MBO1766709.1 cytochrome c oxidase subunit 4 [Allobranchiibius sp. GilTou38]